ncbi:MAG: helix-turn-helix transcriptional regulator [Clostridia bacterium]|nr:helix-turn-helix transcriptional regulator [Clostridia bacterium]
MDQVKIGKFIQERRKEKKLTQRELSERLNISDKTVSKWETGNGLPEVGLMLPLCAILEISVNELLSGEKLDEKQYQQKAEENIMGLMEERQRAKKRTIFAVVAVLIAMAIALPLLLIAEYADLTTPIRVVLVVIGFVVIVFGTAIACVFDRDAGVYECTKCGERFVPTMKAYVFGAHTIMRRRLKCPKCGVKNYCRRRWNR